MAILFPAALDTFRNPTKFDNLPASTALHHQQESDQNDAIEELEKIVGALVGTPGATNQLFIILQRDDGQLIKAKLVVVEGQTQWQFENYP